MGTGGLAYGLVALASEEEQGGGTFLLLAPGLLMMQGGQQTESNSLEEHRAGVRKARRPWSERV